MAHTTKHLSDRDAQQTLRSSYNDVDASITTNGFLIGKVGHKIVQDITTTTITGDTAVFTFSDSGVLLYQLTLIYTDATQATLISAERTA